MMQTPYRRTIDRREALLRISATLVAGGAVTAGGLFFYDRNATAPTARSIPDWRTAEPHILPGVIAHGDDPAQNVRRALHALGGMDRFVKKGHTVLIKPNVGWDRLPEQAADTNPEVVAELVRLCLAAGARRVIVSDISCNDPSRSFEHSGIGPAARAAGAIVASGTGVHLVHARTGGPVAGLDVMGELLDADRVINVPVVKQHSLSQATLGMKNWFGVLGTGRARLHQDIHHSIAELAATFRPTLTVVDATRILMASGPQGGSLADVKQVRAIAAGIDPVACDAWGASLLGLDPRRVGFIAAAEGRGLGRADPGILEDLGTA